MGQELVRSERVASRVRILRGAALFFLALSALAAACRQAPSKPRGTSVPKMRVTAFVMRTNLLPEKKAFVHLVILSGDKVRLGDETDSWRLFDMKNETVTFVDAVAKTYRIVPVRTLIGDRMRLVSTPTTESVPTARFTSPAATRTLFGFPARQHVIEAGPYRREIWMSDATPIGDRFFAMLVASEPMSERYAPMMRDATRGLLALKGFPVLDRSDMPYDGATWTVERRLEKVEQRDVPIALMTIPGDYKDITPSNAPAAGRRPASSPPRDQRTPAAE